MIMEYPSFQYGKILLFLSRQHECSSLLLGGQRFIPSISKRVLRLQIKELQPLVGSIIPKPNTLSIKAQIKLLTATFSLVIFWEMNMGGAVIYSQWQELVGKGSLFLEQRATSLWIIQVNQVKPQPEETVYLVAKKPQNNNALLDTAPDNCLVPFKPSAALPAIFACVSCSKLLFLMSWYMAFI